MGIINTTILIASPLKFIVNSSRIFPSLTDDQCGSGSPRTTVLDTPRTLVPVTVFVDTVLTPPLIPPTRIIRFGCSTIR